MRRNNKALYEQIMKSVSREVKKTLNEYGPFGQNNYFNLFRAASAARAIRKIFKLEGIDNLYIDKKHSRIDDYIYLSRIFIDSEDNKLTLYVSEDYYPSDPDITDFVYKFTELDDVGIDPNQVYIAVRDQLGDPYPDIETQYKPYIG